MSRVRHRIEIIKQFLLRKLFLPYITRNKEYTYFLCSRGIGDNVYFCLFLNDYKKNHKDEKIALIFQESHQTLFEMFEQSYDKKIVLTNERILKLNQIQLGTKPYISDKFHYILPPSAFYYLGYRGLCLLDIPKVLLDLPEDATPTIPDFELKSITVEEFIAQHDLVKNKTLIIAPYAFSTPKFDVSIWDQVVGIAVEKGYKVITNIQEGEECLKNTIPFSGSLYEVCELASYSGFVISNRSGLCDLLSLNKLCMIVLYADEKYHFRYSFKNIKLKAQVHELVGTEKFYSIVTEML